MPMAWEKQEASPLPKVNFLNLNHRVDSEKLGPNYS
jgi:hypothetical protein